MGVANRFCVSVQGPIEGAKEPARLDTRAHTVMLSADGTLILLGEKQRRVLRPDMWSSYTVTYAKTP